MGANAAVLALKIVTDARDAQAGLDKAAGKAGKFKARLGTASKAATIGLLAVGAAAFDAAKGAADDAESQAVLAAAMKKNAKASDAQIAANEDWIASMASATGVADDQLRPALGDLVRATGSVEKSQEALKIAMDVSAATGKPLQAVSKAMAKGFGGSTGALGKLVPGLDKAAVKSGDMSKIMGELAKKTGGAMAASADTAAGKIRIAQNAMDEAKESAGAALLPALAALAGVLAKVGAFAQEHAGAVQVFAVAIGGLAAAVLLVNYALKVYQATLLVVQAVQKATWLSNPIGLVILAVIALVAAVVLLWKKSETFRRIVLGVWAAIKTAGAAVATWLRAAWSAVWSAISGFVRAHLIVLRAVFTALRTAAAAVLSWLRSAWSAAWSWIAEKARAYRDAVRAVWTAIREAASAAIGWLREKWSGLWTGLKSAASRATDVLTAPFRAMYDAVQKVLDLAGTLINKIKGIHFPKIPGLPGGKSATAAAAAPAGLGVGLTAGGPVPLAATSASTVIYVSGVLTDADAARTIKRILRTDDRRGRGVLVRSVTGRGQL